MHDYKDKNMICFGGQDWWYHNHSHVDLQLMRCCAAKHNVLYINSIVMQKPSFKVGDALTKKIIRKSKSIFAGLKKNHFGFWVYSPWALPVHHIKGFGALNNFLIEMQIKHVVKRLKLNDPVVWVVVPTACNLAIKLTKHRLLYLRTDVYEEFPGVNSKQISEYDRTLKANADLTIFVSQILYEEESSQCKKAIYVDHGVDYEDFAFAEMDKDMPRDLVDIPKPIVGFFGEIAEYTVDIGFLEKTVECLPEGSFVFVGDAPADCSRLLAKKNVWMLGKKRYERIPHYGKCFDVAIMPWNQNRWIKMCNPIKLKEYLALGKPIVSTPFPELQRYSDVVYKANNPEDFARCIKKAMSEDNSERIAKRKRKVKAESWDSKANLILKELFKN